MFKKKDSNIFTLIGIIVAAAAAVAGIAYAVYYFVNSKRYLCDGDCYDFDCEDCDDDCNECPLCKEESDDSEAEDEASSDDAE